MAEHRRKPREPPRNILYLEENHGNITKLISDAGSGSAKILRSVTFEFDSIFPAQVLQNLSFLHHIHVLA